jgi:hypothetical protein
MAPVLKDRGFFFLLFLVFVRSQLLYPPPFYLRFSENSAQRFRKNPEIWNDNSRSTTDPKNLKISQCYVTITYNTQYFFYQNRWGTATKNNEIPWNGPGWFPIWKDVIKHITVCLTSYPWKQSRIPVLCVLPFSTARLLQVFGFSWVSKPEPHCLFPKRWRSNPLHPTSPDMDEATH